VSDEEGSMFKKKHEDEELAAPPPKKKQDEHAYEDAWYRALKAQAELASDSDEAVEAAED
jgi:hypothetical protein